jgi:hyperosmotically inducible periplasmic protein
MNCCAACRRDCFARSARGNLEGVKAVLIAFGVGALVGVGGYWYYDEHLSALDRWYLKQKVRASTEEVTQAVMTKASEINADAVKAGIARSGVYIAEQARAAGAYVADATADARITAAVKSKVMGEAGFAALSIHVTTADGVVTLSGAASSHEQVARAVRLALEAQGVRKVISTIQVQPARPSATTAP